MGDSHLSGPLFVGGVPILGGGIPPFNIGDLWFVDAKFGSNGRTGKNGWGNAMETMVEAEDRAGDGTNDVILMDGLKSSGGPTYKYQEAAEVAWDKDNIHVFGAGTFGALDPLPEWSLDATGRATTAVSTLHVSGVGNTFTNIRLTGNGTDAANLCALKDNGENNVYTLCQFMKTNDLGDTAVADVLAHGDSSTYRRCKFGAVWYTVTAARQGILVSGTQAAGRMKSNYFEGCYHVVASTSADYVFLRVNAAGALSMENIFRDSIMCNALIGSISAIQLTVAVESIAGLVEGNIFFVNAAHNCAKFATTSNQIMQTGYGQADSTTIAVGIGITPS